MKVAVTGGSGVVGSAVVRHLVAAGDEVVATARSSTSAEALRALGARPVEGEILDHVTMRSSFEGCEVVYHVAGVNETCSRDPRHMYRVNVEGTRTVIRAAAAAGVRRIVYTSSAAVIGEPKGVVATEDTPHRGHFLSKYEESKHDAELVAFAEKTSVEVVAVNPSSVQGPGRATGTGKLILQVLAGKLPVLVESVITIVDIDDCARGHLLAAQHGTPGERYLLSGFTTTVSGAVDLASSVLGRSVKARMLPIPVAWVGSALVSGVSRLMGRQPPLCPEMVRVIAHGHHHDGSKATRQLGLEYKSAEATIRRMVEWFRAEGLL